MLHHEILEERNPELALEHFTAAATAFSERKTPDPDHERYYQDTLDKLALLREEVD